MPPTYAPLECIPHVDVGGVRVDALDRSAWRAYLEACVSTRSGHHHVSLNAAKWVALDRDPALAAAVGRAGSIAADGVGIVWASRLLGAPLPERVPGCDLADDLMRSAATWGWRVALLGARPEVLDRVTRQLRARGVPVVFAEHGYYEPAREAALVARIREARPHLLLVALGTPRAELFIDEHRAALGVPLAMGVGGTFDVWAGAARRAPPTLQRAGLEWAWRLAGNPRARFRRALLDSARFVHAIARGRRVSP